MLGKKILVPVFYIQFVSSKQRCVGQETCAVTYLMTGFDNIKSVTH